MSYSNTQNYSLSSSPSCAACLCIFYGIGKIKASRLNCFLLNHPVQTVFHKDPMTLMNEPIGFNMQTRLPVNKKVCLFVIRRLMKKINIFCYQAYRIFQNLPTKGQRTKANAGTPRRLNPYLSININQKFYHEKEIEYKQLEFRSNGRFKQLEAFNKALEDKEKMQKQDMKTKKKKSIQDFIKKQKNYNRGRQ